MKDATPSSLDERVDRLAGHLERENPVLLDVVRGFRRLDDIAYKLDILDRTDSFAIQVSWWPVISVLGTFSSGKSTFLNHYLEQRLQPTGNQAVDDKFTVICYGREERPRVLPGLALDSDPRFSFYQISKEIDDAASGEGRRLDVYLQLKTCHSEKVRGKILIDSPGFDADAQRTSTLRITDHIIDLSDLVLVFFDARHPEPGAMQDTLEHLVTNTLKRPDFDKFLYILNQIDNTAREDNPEEVFAAWQRALAQKGLTAGRFYRIYDPDSAIPIQDPVLRKRFESKREKDAGEILGRMREVEVERAYRVTSKLEKMALAIRDTVVPRVNAAKQSWKRRTLWLDLVAFGVLVVGLIAGSIYLGYWDGLSFNPPWRETIVGNPPLFWTTIVGVLLVLGLLHVLVRRVAAHSVVREIRADSSLKEKTDWVVRAFLKNTRLPRSIFFTRVAGWRGSTRKKLNAVLAEADKIVQALNDRYTNPSGEVAPSPVVEEVERPEEREEEEKEREAVTPPSREEHVPSGLGTGSSNEARTASASE